MLGVIWGHLITNLLCGEPNTISIHWIFRTYDMPMFMLISGYFLSHSLQKRSSAQLFFDKITTILFPTVLGCVGYCLMYKHLNVSKHLYFLWAIFVCSEIIIICNFVKRKTVKYFLMTIPLILLHLTSRRFFNLSYLYPFFLLGFSGFGLNGKIFDNNKKYFVFLFIALLCFWSTKYTIWKVSSNLRFADLHTIFIIVFRLFIGCIGCIAAMHIFDILFEFMVKRKSWLYTFIIKSGKETLALYIFQDYICFVLIKRIANHIENIMGYNIFNFNESFLGYVIAPTLALIIMALILRVTEIIKSNKYTTKLLGFKIILPYHKLLK